MYRVISQFSGFEVGTILTDAQLKEIDADVKDLIEVGCLEKGAVLTKDEAKGKKLDLSLLAKAYADGEWKVWMAAEAVAASAPPKMKTQAVVEEPKKEEPAVINQG
jgi:hypothetical protein